jgi:protein-disulfide isomerase
MTVELVEWGDFECPYCANAYPAVKEVRARLGDRVSFRWRHFPITSKHPHAEHAAEAAEAARAEGLFDPMHDLLFANRTALGDDDLRRYAEQIGMDGERFAADLASGRFASAVASDRREGDALGVRGTPTFFIGGERYEGFYDAESLFDALEDAGA